MSLSLSEPLLTLGWHDEDALTLPINRRYQKELRLRLRKLVSQRYSDSLHVFWVYFTSGKPELEPNPGKKKKKWSN